MTTTASKTGRKNKFHHFTGDNLPVVGLCKDKGNRWRIALGQDHPMTGRRFTEVDERKAIARFHELTGASGIKQIIAKTQPDGDGLTLSRVGAPLAVTDVKGLLETARATYDTGTQSMPLDLDCPEVWAFVADQILLRPKYVAVQTGITEIGYLQNLKPPTASPVLKGLLDAYVTKPGLSSNEQTRSRHFWAEFLRWTGATTLADITHETVKRYEAKARAEVLAAKSIKHRFGKVKTVIAYALKRGTDALECRRALDVLAMLEMPKATGLDPHPITPADFWAVYKAATAAGDQTFATMMLTALNCCMYSGECCALKWSEVNLKTGEVVTRRPKTGVARVAVLWPETLKAIAALPRERDNLFFSERVGYSAQLVWKRWTRYATQLGIAETAHFSDIRDSAYTTACRSVSLDKAKILAGHRLSGATDHYVQRNPQFVVEACKAIAKAFEVAKHVKAK